MLSEEKMDGADRSREPHTAAVAGSYLAVALFLLLLAFKTVHSRPSGELEQYPTSMRSNVQITRWIEDGYWHYCGLNAYRDKSGLVLYRSSTGGYLISGFIVEKIYSMITGHYGWRLLALHNQLVSALTAALLALLAFRIAARFGLSPLHAWVLGAAVEVVHFTFPDNLDLYWEMSAQASFLLFAVVFLLAEEARLRGRGSAILDGVQIVAAFLLTYMEYVAGLAFICTYVAISVILACSRERVRRVLLLAVLPCVAAFGLYKLQLTIADHRFPNVTMTGSQALFRSGLDGDARYYRDHLDIAFGRDLARRNFKSSPAMLFQWKWLFLTGSLAAAAILMAFGKGRAQEFHVLALGSMIGTYVLYAAAFSQAIVIHPYLYDVLLATPLILALYAAGPALLETGLRRTGVVVLVIAFCAVWYAFFQLRLYALRHPLPLTASTRVVRAGVPV
jgi:hypothetical protein